MRSTTLLVIWERRYHFIGNFEKEAPFKWLFGRRGTILLVKFGQRLVEFFHVCPKLSMRSWLEFHFMVHVLPGGSSSVDQVISLVWPKLRALQTLGH